MNFLDKHLTTNSEYLVTLADIGTLQIVFDFKALYEYVYY